MEKYTNVLKCEEIKRLVSMNKYDKALKILQTVDTNKIRTLSDLMMFAEVYDKNKIYDEAMTILYRIYGKSTSRRVVYQLAKLNMKAGNFDEAEQFYQEYTNIAPRDSNKYILRYHIDKAKGEELKVLIASLEKFNKLEYSEDWAYELAKLYHKAGMKEKCVSECSNIILFFGDGIIVEKCKMLREYYTGHTEALDNMKNRDREEFARNLELYNTIDISKAVKEAGNLLKGRPQETDNERLEKTKEVQLKREGKTIPFKRAKDNENKPNMNSFIEDIQKSIARTLSEDLEDGPDEIENSGTYEDNDETEASLALKDMVYNEDETNVEQDLHEDREDEANSFMMPESPADESESYHEAQSDGYGSAETEYLVMPEQIEQENEILEMEQTTNTDNENSGYLNDSDCSGEDISGVNITEQFMNECRQYNDFMTNDEYRPLGDIHSAEDEQTFVIRDDIDQAVENNAPADNGEESSLYSSLDSEKGQIEYESVYVNQSQQALNDVAAASENQREEVPEYAADVTENQLEEVIEYAADVTEGQREEVPEYAADVTEEQREEVPEYAADVTENQLEQVPEDVTAAIDNQPEEGLEGVAMVSENQPQKVQEEAQTETEGQLLNIPSYAFAATDNQLEENLGNIPSSSEINNENDQDKEFADTPISESRMPDEIEKSAEDFLFGDDNIEYLFQNFTDNSLIRKQLKEAFRGIYNRQVSANFLIIGNPYNGRTMLAKTIARALFKIGLLASSKVAKITGTKLNKLDLDKKRDQLSDACVIIEGAGELTPKSVHSVIDMIEHFEGRNVVILEDSEEAIHNLINSHSVLSDYFQSSVILPEYGAADLFGFAINYLLEQDYRVSDEGILIIRDMADQITKQVEAKERLAAMMNIIIQAKENADRRNMNRLKDIVNASSFDEDNLNVIETSDLLG